MPLLIGRSHHRSQILVGGHSRHRSRPLPNGRTTTDAQVGRWSIAEGISLVARGGNRHMVSCCLIDRSMIFKPGTGEGASNMSPESLVTREEGITFKNWVRELHTLHLDL
jgi:hypothetical protein